MAAKENPAATALSQRDLESVRAAVREAGATLPEQMAALIANMQAASLQEHRAVFREEIARLTTTLTESDMQKLRVMLKEELSIHRTVMQQLLEAGLSASVQQIAGWFTNTNNPVIREIARQVLEETAQMGARLARLEREAAALAPRLDALENPSAEGG